MKRELNEYLFHEFGVEDSELRISDSWPFELKELGMVEGEHVFEFNADGEEFFAISGRALRFDKKDGADLPLLGRQIRGSRWIGARGPVSLSTSRGEHPFIPMIPERRMRIEELACRLGHTGVPKILEGLFLEKTREYLALVEFPNEEVFHVIGSSIQIPGIPKSEVSAWKVLSRAVGSRV